MLCTDRSGLPCLDFDRDRSLLSSACPFRFLLVDLDFDLVLPNDRSLSLPPGWSTDLSGISPLLNVDRDLSSVGSVSRCLDFDRCLSFVPLSCNSICSEVGSPRGTSGQVLLTAVFMVA